MEIIEEWMVSKSILVILCSQCKIYKYFQNPIKLLTFVALAVPTVFWKDPKLSLSWDRQLRKILQLVLDYISLPLGLGYKNTQHL